MNICIPIAFLLALGACTQVGLATSFAENKSVQAIENTRRLNDLEARLAITTPCIIRLGSYHRALTDVEKRAADLLCGGGAAVTADDVQSLREYIEILEASRDAVNDREPE